MELWKIKSEALRLMFADSDMEFNRNEFENGIVYDNHNTREKLVGMEASIRRAIDLYYQYNDTMMLMREAGLEVEGEVVFAHIDPNDFELFGNPIRVDAFIYNKDKILYKSDQDIEFIWDPIVERILVDINYIGYKEDVVFKVWYKAEKINLPFDTLEMEYNLNELYIPEEVQRKIPFYIKGELYEEDEPNLAMQSKNEYIQFIMGLKKKYGKVQKKVKPSPIFTRNR